MNKSGKYFLSFLIMVYFTQCARKSIPTGGLKDTLPPIMINASPKMNTVFFDKEKITITFDEFIKLKDISKQLIIFPSIGIDKYKVKPQGTVAKKFKSNYWIHLRRKQLTHLILVKALLTTTRTIPCLFSLRFVYRSYY